MDPIFTGLGLAGAAGLNAYIPLLILAVAGRLGYADLSTPYSVLSSNLGLGILTVLLIVEVFADKLPGVDHVNDVVNTVVRPAAGAVLFLSSSGAGQLNPLLAAGLGLVSAGGIHAMKATGRPVITLTTGGIGNPIVSVLEDVVAIGLALLALAAPIAVAVVLLVLIALFFLGIRRLRGRHVRRQTTASP